MAWGRVISAVINVTYFPNAGIKPPSYFMGDNNIISSPRTLRVNQVLKGITVCVYFKQTKIKLVYEVTSHAESNFVKGKIYCLQLLLC